MPSALLAQMKATRMTAGAVSLSRNKHPSGGAHMKNPLDSLWGTVISGLILTFILFMVVNHYMAR
jgi:uncharacterized membrane protein YkvI